MFMVTGVLTGTWAPQDALSPRDAIATGSPAGVRLGVKPQTWLQPNDLIRMETPSIGVLENGVVSQGAA